jgi:hypothetical protein
MTTTAPTVITLWILKWMDLIISREHRAVMVATADNGWAPVSDLSALVALLKCRTHFRECKANPIRQKPSSASRCRGASEA